MRPPPPNLFLERLANRSWAGSSACCRKGGRPRLIPRGCAGSSVQGIVPGQLQVCHAGQEAHVTDEALAGSGRLNNRPCSIKTRTLHSQPNHTCLFLLLASEIILRLVLSCLHYLWTSAATNPGVERLLELNHASSATSVVTTDPAVEQQQQGETCPDECKHGQGEAVVIVSGAVTTALTAHSQHSAWLGSASPAEDHSLSRLHQCCQDSCTRQEGTQGQRWACSFWWHF